jgi:hypothetical protein
MVSSGAFFRAPLKSIATNKIIYLAASPRDYQVLNEAAVAGKIDYFEGLKEKCNLDIEFLQEQV